MPHKEKPHIDTVDNETIETKRKRLIFRSWHRGTREMDLLMGNFADKYIPGFTEQELEEYNRLLKNNDPDIYNWYTMRETPPDEENSDVLRRLMNFQISENKDES